MHAAFFVPCSSYLLSYITAAARKGMEGSEARQSLIILIPTACHAQISFI